MSVKNQREQLMHTAVGQVTTIIFVALWTWFYSIPLYSSLSASVLSTNVAIENYKNTVNDGISFSNITTLLKARGQEELLGVIQFAPTEAQNVIKKVGSGPYLAWLRTSIESNEATTEKTKIETKKARLNSILPTLSPLSNSISEDTVSMKKYISFVEENIIKKYSLDSVASLSLQNITYGKKGWPAWSMTDVIGSFDNDISFKTTNNNIFKMINYINQLGHPELLTDTGAMSDDWIPAIMSNPLAMIDSLSLESSLDMTKLNEKNSGRMTLRFYVRGSSATDIAYLKTAIATRNTALGKKIELKLTNCTKDTTCSNAWKLQILFKKYNEYNTSNNNTKVNPQWTELMYSLSAELDSIIAFEEELKNIN